MIRLEIRPDVQAWFKIATEVKDIVSAFHRTLGLFNRRGYQIDRTMAEEVLQETAIEVWQKNQAGETIDLKKLSTIMDHWFERLGRAYWREVPFKDLWPTMDDEGQELYGQRDVPVKDAWWWPDDKLDGNGNGQPASSADETGMIEQIMRILEENFIYLPRIKCSHNQEQELNTYRQMLTLVSENGRSLETIQEMVLRPERERPERKITPGIGFFIEEQRKDHGYGDKRLKQLIVQKFGIDISESAIYQYLQLKGFCQKSADEQRKFAQRQELFRRMLAKLRQLLGDEPEFQTNYAWWFERPDLEKPTIKKVGHQELVYLRAQPEEAIEESAIVCLECGLRMKQINSTHLQKLHGLNHSQYRHKWGYQPDTPLCSEKLRLVRKWQKKQAEDASWMLAAN